MNTLCAACHAAAMLYATNVVAKCAAKYGVSAAAILSRERVPKAVNAARKEVVVTLRRDTWLSFPDIGELLNRRSATVIYLARTGLYGSDKGRPGRKGVAPPALCNVVEHEAERAWEVWAGLESHGRALGLTFVAACLRMFKGDTRFDPLALTLAGVPLTTLPMGRVDR